MATVTVCHFLHRLDSPTPLALPSGIIPVSSWASDLNFLIYKREPNATVDVKAPCDQEFKLVYVGLLSLMLISAGCSKFDQGLMLGDQLIDWLCLLTPARPSGSSLC